jgi:hypothetical protein
MKILDANLIRVAPSAVIQPGLPVCIVELLATVHTLKNDKGMHKEKRNAEDWNFLSDLRPPYRVSPW